MIVTNPLCLCIEGFLYVKHCFWIFKGNLLQEVKQKYAKRKGFGNEEGTGC